MLLSLQPPSLLFTSKSKPKTRIRTLSRSSLFTKPKSKPESKSASQSAIQRISDKLRHLGYLEPSPSPNPNPNPDPTAGEIFIPTPHELPRRRVGYTIDSSWSTPDNPVPAPGTGIARFRELWKKEKEGEGEGKREGRVPMVAEVMIEKGVLRRLRKEGIRIEKRMKVGKAGVTEGVVNGIHERWRSAEMVKIKCEDLCRMNMKRTHEILERKTGGLVVWRSGSIIILYRGADYKYPYFSDEGQRNAEVDNIAEEPSMTMEASIEHEEAVTSLTKSTNFISRPSLVNGVRSPNKVRLQLTGEVQLEEELDKLLEGLGPRFSDWWGYEPLPVDADLLPPIVHGFRKPFRLLPYGIKPKLTDREMTILRRLSRPLPCHFALGRNRNLQGLAVSMIKLWEKCEVAKIAIKRGVQNTNSEIMVEELKRLTGGTLLSRDKEFITFYRGKDFLPSAVSTAIEERRNSVDGRQKQNNLVNSPIDTGTVPLRFEIPTSIDEPAEASEQTRLITKERRLKTTNTAIKRVETKLSLALEKKEKAEKLLAELENCVEPSVVEPDKEAITEEERYMLRKVGLRMKPFLLLGRRGVFAGTVENMHLHWKYRELVKIISRDKSVDEVENAARTLEMESGGILVAVERVNKGHAIIMYRGKNYRRPSDLRPKTLLNKREAMKRSLEAQRRESLKLHVLSLSRDINQLQHQMLSESCKSGTKDEMNNKGESSYHQENTEEVNEASAEYSHLNKREEEKSNIISSTPKEVSEADVETVTSNEHGCITNSKEELTLSSNNIIKSTCSQQVPELTNNIGVPLFTNSTEDAHIPDAGCISTLRRFDPESFPQPDQASISATSDLSQSSYEDESQQSEVDSFLYDDEIEDGFDREIPFRAAPLSNRERLILRKQALKMRKRPVLAVGRNNIITGVAKTIKTHFKKYPLAIVNIKGRAEGTSVQEVIFELEQATGAVLVSREPNKVILYRGWGEGEEQPRGDQHEKKGEKKGSKDINEEAGRVSPELMEAIRVECGLSTN